MSGNPKPIVELPRITDCPLEDVTDPGWQAVRNRPAGNVQGLNTGLNDGAFFLVGPNGERIVGSDQGSTLNEGIRGVNSGDSFLDRAALVRIPGSTHIFRLKMQGNKGGYVIHADGRITPQLVSPGNGARAKVRLVGWQDFGRESTFYQRPEDGRRRYVPEPQPDAPELDAVGPVLGPIAGDEVIVDEGGGQVVSDPDPALL